MDKQLIWQRLAHQATQMPSIAQLFSLDGDNQQNRAQKYHLQTPYFLMDYSKQCINDVVMADLLALAQASELKQKMADLFSGRRVNDSENRQALHTALRLPKTSHLMVDGVNVVEQVHDSLDKAQVIIQRIHSGIWRGFSGKAISDVVNIGVGGSDLGPLMATEALSAYQNTGVCVHFVSNMDGTHMQNLLSHLNPETTLFIIASKSFGTIDTLSNAKTALSWLTRFTTKDVALRRHFIGVSANPQKMSEWGIHQENQLLFWSWVGGRFSMWSVIGLAIAVAIGMDNFKAMLKGAHMMDEHFASMPFEQNAPVLMGLLAVWNATFLKINGHTVLPYDGRLKFLPSYLTQLEMESNGKSVTKEGQKVDYATCPILWGEVGSNAQHAFYQLLHQGTQRISCDFITCIHRYDNVQENQTLSYQHDLALSNCLAQSRVLALGNEAIKEQNTSPFHQYRGNQPSTTLLLDTLTPESLGALVALYEHKVYVASVLWHINPFDQWGVEMGKKMAQTIFHAMHTPSRASFDASTNFLLDAILHKDN